MGGVLKHWQNKFGVPQTGTMDDQTAKAVMFYYQLNPFEAANFLGQLDHETGGFRHFIENMNYTTPERIVTVFKIHFKGGIEEAKGYVRNPEKLANKVYANRMGNGNPESGDGFRFRGRGMLQLTGRNNYTDFSRWKGMPEILINPDLVAKEYAFDSGKYYFEKNKIWNICTDITEDTITRVSKFVNIGNPNSRIVPHGLADRINKTKKYYAVLTDSK
jgi:putative chitinase